VTQMLPMERWVRLISEEEMPVLAQTARHVAGISSGSDSSTADLARVVLMDSAMTARVLRLANSVYYNPAGKRVITVSRAIVMLGFETVRTIAISIAMVDTLLRGKRHDHVVTEMARAFHAAVQAKSMAAKRGEPAVEEVFIAALLMRLGAMAFWCFPQDFDVDMERALAGADDPDKAERSVLGFSLSELTAALNREWHLSDLLGHVLDGRHGTQPRVQIIEICHRLATSTCSRGWDAPQTRQLIARATKLMNATEEEATQLFHANARQERGAENPAARADGRG
jgi:HD-like signal output (HDOD) protein